MLLFAAQLPVGMVVSILYLLTHLLLEPCTVLPPLSAGLELVGSRADTHKANARLHLVAQMDLFLFMLGGLVFMRSARAHFATFAHLCFDSCSN